MKILRRYILKECLPPFLMALMVLSCVFLLGYTVRLAHLIINKGVPLSAVAGIFLLLIPVLLTYTIPLASIISVIMAFGRLSADNEVIAIRASGIPLYRLIIPLAVIGMILSLGSFYLNNKTIPRAYHKEKTLRRSIGMENVEALLEPGVFITDFPGQTLFIHRMDGNQFYNITIWQPGDKDGPTRTIIAKRGEFTKTPDGKTLILKLMDGTSDEVNIQDPDRFYKLRFDTLFIKLDISAAPERIEKKPKGMTIRELRGRIRTLEPLMKSRELNRLHTEIYRRITWSFAPVIFILVGFPLAIITNHREKSANTITAVLCAAAYYVLAMGAQGLASEGKAPVEIIMWVPNAAGLLAMIFLNRKICAS